MVYQHICFSNVFHDNEKIIQGFGNESVLTRSAGEGLPDPGRPLGAVLRLVDLLEVDQPGGLLLEVGEHGGQHLPAEEGGAAHGREGAHSLQEVLIGVGGVGAGEESVEAGLAQDRLQPPDIVWVVEAPRVDGLNCRGGQHACGAAPLSHSSGDGLLGLQPA